MDKTKEECFVCKFFDRWYNDKSEGSCRYNQPPFPHTHITNWCGRFKLSDKVNVCLDKLDTINE